MVRGSAQVQRLAGVLYDEAPSIERLVFVCALHKSGSSLLEHLLVSRLHLSCLRMSVPENEGQHAQSVYSPAYKFGGPGRFAFSHDMTEELRRLTDHEAARELILGGWRRFVVGHSEVLIEKSPPNLTKMWWLRRTFGGAKFIILVRNPLAVSAATQRLSGTSLEELMMHWNVAYSVALRDFRPEDSLIVRYEDLIDHPDRSVSDIAAFAGVAMREAPLDVAKRFSVLSNSNSTYIQSHSCTDYGRGAWDALGYGAVPQDLA